MSHRSAPAGRGSGLRWSLRVRPRVLLSMTTAIAVTVVGILLASPDRGGIVALHPGSKNPQGPGSAAPAGPGTGPVSAGKLAHDEAPRTAASVAAPPPALPVPDATIAFPLHTQGSSIVDASGSQVKLNLVNWYGAESPDYVVGGLKYQPVASIVNQIVSMGFNGVRLPWSEQMWQANPVVSAGLLTANKQFIGQHARTIFEAVVKDVAAAGLMVVLDNQVSSASCCISTANNLWYSSGYSQSQWLTDWKSMASAFKNVPQVIGADLRNEPRGAATWGGSPADDWHAAAERGGDAVLSADPQMLIFVEGTDYATDLSGIASLPVVLSQPGHVVYSVHDYSFDTTVTGYDQWVQKIQASWGYLVGRYPLLVGEFGTCDSAGSCVDSPSSGSLGPWFTVFTRYLAAHNLSWSYWALNGTMSDQDPSADSHYGGDESNGLLNPTWSGPGPSPVLSAVQAIQPSCPAGTLADGTYYIRNLGSGDVIDIPAFKSAQGTDLDQWPLDNGMNQRWQVTRITCNLYTIQSVMDGESVDIDDQSAAPGAKVDQYRYWGGGNQQFVISQNEAGYYSITSINSTDPVAVPNSSTSKGTLLEQSGATGGANQQWSFLSA
jgi:endoglucanase